MDTKAKRKVIAEMLDKLKADMLAAVEQMPGDWDETQPRIVLCLVPFTIQTI
jgi:hypothetical protein